MVMEASSHALSQGRCAGIDFAAAAFTNLTGDHLDYHKTLDNYLAAKAMLFEDLSEDATAVLNANSPQSKVARARGPRPGPCGTESTRTSDLAAHIESMDATGTAYRLRYGGQGVVVRSPLLGQHNVSNHLAAAGLCLAAGLDLRTIADGLAALTCVPGRLDRVEWDGPFSVLVDFAHTDDALQNVLTTLRPLCRGRLIAVFGCGGDRDRTKRPRMARVVEALADRVVVTSDNPRTEDPQQIIREILAGLANPQAEGLHVEPDRRAAIEWAIGQARPGDIVLIAGKGHEAYQIIGKQKFPFSDKDVAQRKSCRGGRPDEDRSPSVSWSRSSEGPSCPGPWWSDHLRGSAPTREPPNPATASLPSRANGSTATTTWPPRVSAVRSARWWSGPWSGAPVADKVIVCVPDATLALGDLAREYRRQHRFKVVAITGSVGKTTTRQIIAHVLGQHLRVWQSPKNFNNFSGCR